MSCPFDAKVATARESTRIFCTNASSLVAKNQIGALCSGTCAVIGRVCPSSAPSIPSITVLSDSSAFQNLLSRSSDLLILQLLFTPTQLYADTAGIVGGCVAPCCRTSARYAGRPPRSCFVSAGSKLGGSRHDDAPRAGAPAFHAGLSCEVAT